MKSSENSKGRLQKELRDLEKELAELKRSYNQINVIKKSENRAKNEKNKMKEELSQTTIDFGNKESEILKRFNELSEENKRLMMKIEGLQAKNKENMEKSNHKAREFCESEENLKNMEFKFEEVRFFEIFSFFLFFSFFSFFTFFSRFFCFSIKGANKDGKNERREGNRGKKP